MTDIDRSAPVVASHTLTVDAPIDLVWSLHTDIADWPRWHQAIGSPRIEGPLAPGSRLVWYSGDLEIASVVHAVEPGRRTVWGGETLGIVGIHAFGFTPDGARTRIMTEESWSGAVVDQDPDGMRQALETSLQDWLRALAAAAEADYRRTDLNTTVT